MEFVVSQILNLLICRCYFKVKFNNIYNLPTGNRIKLLLFLLIIINPLFEEGIFRYLLPKLLPSISNAYTSGILFGLYHLINIYHISLQEVIYQCIFTSWMGYYLYNLNNLFLAIIIHIYHNAIMLLAFKLLDYYEENDKDRILYVHDPEMLQF